MCGRFTLQSPSDALAELFDWSEAGDLRPSYNVAPTQRVPAFRLSPDDESPEIAYLRWGLIPFFAKDASIGARMINARSETVAVKPSFRAAFKRRRCLVPADGFIEWKRVGKEKQPYHITLKNSQYFAMAGLWEKWRTPEGEELQSCTILTTDANEKVGEIHDRMPVILHPDDFSTWTDVKLQDREVLEGLLEAYPSDEIALRAVNKRVNNARNNDPECLEDAG